MSILFKYLFSEIIPMFFIGLVIFIVIILMAQFLQVSEFIIVHNVSIGVILKIFWNMVISLLPIILPISLLFSILLTYSRMSSDSEIVAFLSIGHSYVWLALPAIIFSMFVAIVSTQIMFIISPVARLEFDTMMNNIGRQQIMSALKEKTFSESFFGLVIYANSIEKNKMYDLFIYDNRNAKRPLTIVAKEGQVSTGASHQGQTADILLTDGVLLSQSGASQPVVKFSDYSLGIQIPLAQKSDDRDFNTYTQRELEINIDGHKLNPQRHKDFLVEYHRRIVLAFSCIIFGFLGSVLGFSTNRRSSSSSGFILSIICVSVFWTLFAVAINTAPSSSIPPVYILWIPNFLFILFTLYKWKTVLRLS